MSTDTNIPQKVSDAYGVFKNFFGEEYVDLQSDSSNYAIYVWWPKVTVTNEHNKSIVIQDLYAKIVIQSNGLIPFEYCGFKLNRATYSIEQFLSNYLHSHIQEIPKHDFSEFGSPCLGTGPIGRTIQTLKTDFDEAEWMLFCQELSMYVTVESLFGGPWKHLESVGVSRQLTGYNSFSFRSANPGNFLSFFSMDNLKAFFRYYLKHGHLVIAYRNSEFVCGMSYYEYIIDVSNAFISFYNNHLKADRRKLELMFRANLLNSVQVRDEKFYSISGDGSNIQNIDRYKNCFVLKFKGKDIFTTITDSSSSETFTTTVISNKVAMFILRNILRTINYKYRNEHNSNTAGQQSSAQTCQRTVYL